MFCIEPPAVWAHIPLAIEYFRRPPSDASFFKHLWVDLPEHTSSTESPSGVQEHSNAHTVPDPVNKSKSPRAVDKQPVFGRRLTAGEQAEVPSCGPNNSPSEAGSFQQKMSRHRRTTDVNDPELLRDFSAWMWNFRLHKYTSALQDLRWHQLIKLDDGQLQQRGVGTQGARGKLLRLFAAINQDDIPVCFQ